MEIASIWWQLVGVAPSEKCSGPEQPLGLANRRTRPLCDPTTQSTLGWFLDALLHLRDLPAGSVRKASLQIRRKWNARDYQRTRSTNEID
jgi:hypothetical protein